MLRTDRGCPRELIAHGGHQKNRRVPLNYRGTEGTVEGRENTPIEREFPRFGRPRNVVFLSTRELDGQTHNGYPAAKPYI